MSHHCSRRFCHVMSHGRSCDKSCDVTCDKSGDRSCDESCAGHVFDAPHILTMIVSASSSNCGSLLISIWVHKKQTGMRWKLCSFRMILTSLMQLAMIGATIAFCYQNMGI